MWLIMAVWKAKRLQISAVKLLLTLETAADKTNSAIGSLELVGSLMSFNLCRLKTPHANEHLVIWSKVSQQTSSCPWAVLSQNTSETNIHCGIWADDACGSASSTPWKFRGTSMPRLKRWHQIFQKYFKYVNNMKNTVINCMTENTDIKSYKTMDKPKRINQINLNTTVSYFSVKVSSIIIFFRNNLSYKNTDITLSIKY